MVGVEFTTGEDVGLLVDDMSADVESILLEVGRSEIRWLIIRGCL